MTSRAFHDRPLCTVAAGVLFGTALVRIAAPPVCYAVAAVLAAVAVLARWLGRKPWALLLAAAALALALAGLAYPPDGIFPVTGSVLSPDGKLFARLSAVRAEIGLHIEALFPEHGGVAKAMLLGERGDIAPDMLDAFKRTGILHLLAISGLHVSALAGAFSLLFRKNAWVRFACVALFVAAYAALTAFSPSVVRAGVMLVTLLLAAPFHRRPDRLNALALAFVLILLVNPQALFYTGFQLSFGAVYGLILLAPPIAQKLTRLGSVASGLIAGSLAVTVSTLPAMASAFGRFQPVSLVTNLIVLPLVPFFLIPAFLGTALSFLSFPLGNAVCAVARAAMTLLTSVAAAGGSLDVTLPAPNAGAYLLFLAALPWLSPLCMLPRYEKLRNACILICAALVCQAVW